MSPIYACMSRSTKYHATIPGSQCVHNIATCSISTQYVNRSVINAGPCLYESGLIPKKLSYKEDADLLDYGIGLTNIVPRTTRAADELSRRVPVQR